MHVRRFLLVVGWSSIVGSVGDAALGSYALWQIVAGGADLAISLDAFLQQYVAWIYWVKQIAHYVMPTGLVDWLFGLPALVYFSARIMLSAIIGWWALRAAAAMTTLEQPTTV